MKQTDLATPLNQHIDRWDSLLPPHWITDWRAPVLSLRSSAIKFVINQDVLYPCYSFFFYSHRQAKGNKDLYLQVKATKLGLAIKLKKKNLHECFYHYLLNSETFVFSRCEGPHRWLQFCGWWIRNFQIIFPS